jgi:hypothetical protein
VEDDSTNGLFDENDEAVDKDTSGDEVAYRL